MEARQAVAQVIVSSVEAVKVGFAPVSFPTPDRQQEVDSDFVGELREAQVLIPTRRPAIGKQRSDRTAGRTVRSEKAAALLAYARSIERDVDLSRRLLITEESRFCVLRPTARSTRNPP